MNSSPLEPATAARLRAGLDHLRARRLAAASTELAAIAPRQDALAAVLAARLELRVLKREWFEAVCLGMRLARSHPALEAGWVGWAYALRQLDRPAQARDVLRGAEQSCRESGLVHYHIACCESRLGEFAAARGRLARAASLNPDLMADAATDPELRALYP